MADLDHPELSPSDRHHLERALRLRPGDELVLGDGVGGRRRALMGPVLELAGEVERLRSPDPAITVALAPSKGDRPEWAVQKMTELGVDRVVVFEAARSVVRWEGERAAGHVERLRRIAREAAMQSRRAWLPVVEEVASFASVASRPGAALAVAGGSAPSLSTSVVLIGPEGGWSTEELALGLPTIGLGPHVLRAETAAVTAVALLSALRTGLVFPARAG